MNSPLQDIRNTFRTGGNGLNRLIIVNVAVFVLINLVAVIGFFARSPVLESILLDYLMLPASFIGWLQKPWTLITYFFTHEDVLHVLFNMLFLYWFGQIVHEYLGTRRLMSIYFLGGIMGGLLYMVAYAFVPQFVPYVYTATLLGASGAVYATVTAAATLTPNYTFFLLFLGPVRIVYIAAFYIFMSFIAIRSSNPGGNIAHLGGALLGFVYIKSLRSGTDLAGWFWSLVDRLGGQRDGRMTVSHRAPAGKNKTPVAPSKPASGPGPDEIDAILDKINRVGYENLTREEKEKLFAAGQGGSGKG